MGEWRDLGEEPGQSRVGRIGGNSDRLRSDDTSEGIAKIVYGAGQIWTGKQLWCNLSWSQVLCRSAEPVSRVSVGHTER